LEQRGAAALAEIHLTDAHGTGIGADQPHQRASGASDALENVATAE
jgi:hypothetical protein